MNKWGFAKTNNAATVLARPNKTVAARERNGATRGEFSATARKEKYWNGTATSEAVPTVANALTIVGFSKKKSSPIEPAPNRPSRIRIKVNF
jgi:hypothetical protein